MLLPLLFPSPGDLLDPGVKPLSPALQADSLSLSHLGNRVKPIFISLHDSISSNLYTAFTVLCYTFFLLFLRAVSLLFLKIIFLVDIFVLMANFIIIFSYNIIRVPLGKELRLLIIALSELNIL